MDDVVENDHELVVSSDVVCKNYDMKTTSIRASKALRFVKQECPDGFKCDTL